MISIDAYLFSVLGGLLVFGVIALILGLRQKHEDERAEGHDVPAE